MHQQLLVESIKYFQNITPSLIQPKQLTSHLSLIDQNLPNNAPKSFITNIFSIVVAKYYQLVKAETQVILDQHIVQKIVMFLGRILSILLQSQGAQLNNNILIILMEATLNHIKLTQTTSSAKQSLQYLLIFNHKIAKALLSCQGLSLRVIYPKQYSVCSKVLRNTQIGLRNFSVCLQLMELLLSSNAQIWSNKIGDGYVQECKKRLKDDLQHITDRYEDAQLPFQQKIQNFAKQMHFLYQKHSNSASKSNQIEQLIQLTQDSLTLNKINSIQIQLFCALIQLMQICSISIDASSYSRLRSTLITTRQSQNYYQLCTALLKIDVGIINKKKYLTKLSHLLTQVNSQDEKIIQQTIALFKHICSIRKDHSLINIPHHATTIPLEPLQKHHSFNSYPIKNLQSQRQKQFDRMLVEIVPFFQLETQLVRKINQFCEKISRGFMCKLLKSFNEDILEYQYQIEMSLTRLYGYLSTLLCMQLLLPSYFNPVKNHFQTPKESNQITNDQFTVIYSIFSQLANKTQTLKSLRPSFVEQQIMISVTIQIIQSCYIKLKQFYSKIPSPVSRIKNQQNTLLFIEKTINQFSQSSYLIRITVIIALLNFAKNQNLQITLEQALKPLQSTLLHRNQQNLQLVLDLLRLTTMTQNDYQQIVSLYLNYSNSQQILSYLVPRVSIQSARKCILSVQKWWLVLFPSISYLNNQPMKPTDSSDNFFPNDRQNVQVKNALGVIVLELGEKWQAYLRSTKREIIIDLMIDLINTNSQLVFFRGFFSGILKDLANILRQSMGNSYSKQQQNKQKKEVDGFYGRLRNKIMNLIGMIPNVNFQLWEQQSLNELIKVVEEYYDTIKFKYWAGDARLKQDVILAKKLLEKVQQKQSKN